MSRCCPAWSWRSSRTATCASAFAGLTGGYSATNVLGLDTVTFMDPEKEIPLVFECWEKWLQDAGICDSIADVDFIEIHAFGCQPKAPNPLVDPEGYVAEQERLRTAYRQAYGRFFRENCPDNGVPARFTVHVVDVPDRAASYEFYGVGLYQKALHERVSSNGSMSSESSAHAGL